MTLPSPHDDPTLPLGDPLTTDPDAARPPARPPRSSPAARRAVARTQAEQARANELAQVGLTPGEAVRFRRRVSARWIPATVERVERDGSVGLRDPKGAAVALTVDRIEVRTEGPRGRLLWEPLTDRLARTEQLRLL
jgi:hypothetical protein